MTSVSHHMGSDASANRQTQIACFQMTVCHCHLCLPSKRKPNSFVYMPTMSFFTAPGMCRPEETKEKFRGNLVERLSNIDEATTENVEQWWEEIAEQIKKCGEERCGRSTGKKKTGLESWWGNDETESVVKEKKERLNIRKITGEENDKVEYKTAKRKAKRMVARVKAEAIEGLYDQLETVEGQQEIYRIAAAWVQTGKDIIMADTQCQKCNRRGFDKG